MKKIGWILGVVCLLAACGSDTRLFQQAKFQASQGNWQQALNLYNQLIHRNPQHAAALTNRGLLWEMMPAQNPDEKARNQRYAEEDYLRALEINPNRVETYNNLGALYIDLHRNGEAVLYLNEALIRRPHYFRALLNRANAHTNLGQFSAALQDYNRAGELKPNDPVLLLNRGLTYFAMDKYEAAVNDFSHALAVTPDDARLYVERARAFKKWGYPADAYDDLTQAVQLRSDYALAYYYLADLAFENGEKEQAIGLLVRAKELAPKYVPAYDLMGDMLALEDPVSATANYMVALKLDPQHADKYRAKLEQMKTEEGRYRVMTARFFPQGQYNAQPAQVESVSVTPVKSTAPARAQNASVRTSRTAAQPAARKTGSSNRTRTR